MSFDERIERLDMALSEAGYPGSIDRSGEPYPTVPITGPGSVPKDVLYRGMVLAGLATKCWPCFSTSTPERNIECSHGPSSPPPEPGQQKPQ